jgi:hypothetical protein
LLISAFQILVNEGLISLLTEELTKYLTTMDFEHNNLENTDMMCENIDLITKNEKSICSIKSDNTSEDKLNNAINNIETKSNLFVRRKNQFSSKNEDELKVVIERDNMIVGFVDAVDSDASDDSQSEEDISQPRRKCLKRARSRSPNIAKKVSTNIECFVNIPFPRLLWLINCTIFVETSTN